MFLKFSQIAAPIALLLVLAAASLQPARIIAQDNATLTADDPPTSLRKPEDDGTPPTPFPYVELPPMTPVPCRRCSTASPRP